MSTILASNKLQFLNTTTWCKQMPISNKTTLLASLCLLFLSCGTQANPNEAIDKSIREAVETGINVQTEALTGIEQPGLSEQHHKAIKGALDAIDDLVNNRPNTDSHNGLSVEVE